MLAVLAESVVLAEQAELVVLAEQAAGTAFLPSLPAAWAMAKATGHTIRNTAVAHPIETEPQRTGSAAMRAEIRLRNAKPQRGKECRGKAAASQAMLDPEGD